MHAVDSGEVEAVQVLVDCKACLDNKDEEGKTALMMAAERGDDEAIQVLINSKASLDIQDEDGMTALNLAQGRGNNQSCVFLFAATLEKDCGMSRIDLEDPKQRKAFLLEDLSKVESKYHTDDNGDVPREE